MEIQSDNRIGTEMNMRYLLLSAAAVAFCPILALADSNISGQWQADLGHDVLINMDVLADGHWVSQTIQKNKVVAEMAGTYEQIATDNANGRIVFTPLKSKVTDEHGTAKVEDDTYALMNGGKELDLNSGHEIMKFHSTTKE